MAAGSYRFDQFLLDADNRRLQQGGAVVELNGRYFDALTLLVREPGKLVTKDRFLDEVWRGVPVTDEALTQCIKTLRRQLGDDASRPRFIETVPKHGYRFIAPVEAADAELWASGNTPDQRSTSGSPWQRHLLLAAGGTLGGGVAGLIGGIFYGFAATSQPLQPGMGAMSVLLVMICLTTLLALIGGAGVSFGIAAAGLASRTFGPWSIAGGALGGALVGAVTKLLGIDAFNLLLGQSPGNITGGPEGAMLGGAVGLGLWLGCRSDGSLRKAAAAAAAIGGAAGILIALLGGRLMGGSLDLLSRSLDGSRVRLDQLGALVGEEEFGPASQLVTAGLEGALFGACVVVAMILAGRSFAAEEGETPQR
jgi:DNA-binding winged helix-turn-helix (wHTH) protein